MTTTTDNQEPLPPNVTTNGSITYVTTNGSINRKVAFASVGAALGSVTSLVLATFLLNLPFLANISPEDKGTLKTSLTSGITALVTLLIGYQTKPGAGDGIKEE